MKDIQELRLVDCHLEQSTAIKTLPLALHQCRGITSFCMDYAETFYFAPSLDELLNALGPTFSTHATLNTLELSFPRAILGPMGAKAIAKMILWNPPNLSQQQPQQQQKQQQRRRCLTILVYRVTQQAADILQLLTDNCPQQQQHSNILQLFQTKPKTINIS
uniref:Uncharacterized protein n=1 Tax=Cyclophora tenuis TaxID=216820 RepID=A0A7S1DCY8_CYCTE|eukprot:CAMPEP_0116557750 /NCGR_PEP_ID=MMETSP0397-20121206/9416_1 /TAXON_ID=216820 /ORGANISM="Cyclophora tenuis, Strain ECT3854" /LENGTH=161 /DNA_ID=CAMNT_0004083247 /DNA_START=177 /DNA_END=662 /DNA_ORIENTATION=+